MRIKGRQQAAARHIEAALTVLRVEAHEGQWIDWRRVPARRKIRHRLLGRNPERDLDLALIGGGGRGRKCGSFGDGMIDRGGSGPNPEPWIGSEWVLATLEPNSSSW
jgi:hypothetical protein